jgi:hypothetical protein
LKVIKRVKFILLHYIFLVCKKKLFLVSFYNFKAFEFFGRMECLLLQGKVIKKR